MESPHRKGEGEGGKRKFPTKSGLFLGRSPLFGGGVGVYPADDFTSPDQVIPDSPVKGHIPGRS